MATKKVTRDNDYDLRCAIREIINRNCEEAPYEGTIVDKNQIVDDVINYLLEPENHYSLLKHEK